MLLTFYRFQLLCPRAQLIHVLTAGTHLVQHWRNTTLTNLYYLPDEGRGFFAETGVDEARQCFVVLHSFSSSVLLADYAHGVLLPEV